ncbi:MAG TPA: pantetheine-phosphate adenylyltransferase [Planctomycetota bacterium]|nr:pantetheine-phosphate adenylyltransferase [Planctomycetota bacterium]
MPTSKITPVNRKGVYAGSFDPITNGHMYMIREGAKLFDELVVAIGINPDKRYTFSLDERLEFLRKSTRGIQNVTLDHFTNMFLVDYARKIGAGYILRGVRNPNDYEYERGMRYINADMNPNVTTVFLMPPREISEVSSSFVKGLVGPKGWDRIVKDYLPPPIYRHFLDHYHAGKSKGEGGGLKDMAERV